ncbi:MAG: thiamine pyrophosphate-binding protein [Alphaproteobacteria bacterium CG_4_10_14_0_2_um_filter_63_37]|nr:MAG: thiamine pyrophosphate-binding protein [Proteobacteria bacterium CG1_02_64_396]PJA23941.1 MAG: thiamine pyrophosphate-binding protein [Alphaproteobacteria bacterium CG_4_10_14_0_2_um_filter_63_37]
MDKSHALIREAAVPQWYDIKRAREVINAYNSGGGSGQPADEFVACSIVPAGTGSFRDFSYIAPDLPELIAENCVGCMECVQNCPDTAILGKALTEETLEAELAKIEDEATRALVREQFAKTTKYFNAYEKQGKPGAMFGIFIDPTKCKGCGECVEVCGDHGALKMIKKTPDNLPDYFNIWDFFKTSPKTPVEYVNPRLKVDIMLKEPSLQYVGGAGSCMGCGEASVIRQVMAMTHEIVGDQYGITAATGCNTVYGSTYPFNPFMVPWTNSLFENAPADAMGVRAFWDQQGHSDRALWVFGGDGAMLDIGFQSLSRLLASGMNVKVLCLDTQAYSNTGGQTSTATYMGQEAKMSVHGKVWEGKLERRKELGQIAMMHPNTFVAQTVGPMLGHFYKAIEGALRFKGPAVINVFTTCQPEHGVADDMAAHQARLAVESRAFPVFIYDPSAGRTMKQKLSLQGNPSVDRDWHVRKDGTKVDFIEFARSEGRFRKHFGKEGQPTELLLASKQERLENWWQLQDLAGVVNKDQDGAA